VPDASERRCCRMLQVPRAALRPARGQPRGVRSRRALNAELVRRVATLLQAHPTFGYRRVWALLRFREGWRITRKAVYRVLQHQGWFVHQRVRTPRPRVQGRRSVATAPNTRWAVDVTHIPCGADGWAHLTAVVDCHDRAIIGYEFALRGRAQEAERALEEVCLARFGTVRPRGPTPTLRSDNGLIFQSRRFRAACRAYRLPQEFITPDHPGTERGHRTVLPQLEGGVRLAVCLLRVPAGPADHPAVDCLVQHRAAASSLAVPQPGAIPGPLCNLGGLTSGEQYTTATAGAAPHRAPTTLPRPRWMPT